MCACPVVQGLLLVRLCLVRVYCSMPRQAPSWYDMQMALGTNSDQKVVDAAPVVPDRPAECATTTALDAQWINTCLIGPPR